MMQKSPLLLPLLVSLTILATTHHQVSATITLSTSGKQYQSRPASFGFDLEYGLQYVALLQVVEDDLHLCGGEQESFDPSGDDYDETKGSNEKGWLGEFGEDDDWGRIELHEQQEEGYYEQLMQEHRGLRAAAIPSSFRRLKTVGSIPIGDQKGSNILEYPHNNLGSNTFEDKDPVNAGTLGGNETTTTKKKDIHVMPSHGVPVAILAKRGQCSYETKARIASQQTSPHGTVRFVVVYDNMARDGNHLITMMPKGDEVDDNGEHNKGHDLFKEVGLVFVSYESGVNLREFVDEQAYHVKAQGGPRILIDGSDHWVFPPMDQSAAGLAFLLMLFGCVCSLSLFLNTTLYGTRGSGDGSVGGADHHLFFLGPDGQITDRGIPNNNGGNSRRGRGNGLRLLTMEEVETLPTREYCSPGSLSEGGSPPSSSLELRDKTDMPYMADENEDVEGQHERDSSLHDTAAAAGAGVHDEYDDHNSCARGGLCDALLPTKKEDPDYFDHNTCSICLDEYELGEQIRVLPCQHTFHSNCIFPWLTERSPTCPLCKAMFEAVQYEEEGENGDQQEEGAAAASNSAAGDGEEGQQSVQTEASAPSPSSSSMPPPPLEDEPPVHRRQMRQQEREQRREDRQNDRASRRSRRDSTNADDAVATSGSDTDDAAANEASEAAVSPSGEPRSSSLRGRLWGLFGTAGASSSSAVALEEPLLASDENGDDNVV